jgi:hypothetical protein
VQNIQTKRKALLDALALKRRLQKEVEADTLQQECDSKSSPLFVESPPFYRDDSSNLQVGIRVLIWYPKHESYREGTIVKGKRKKDIFLVDFDDGNSEQWIDCEMIAFQILKRKRGRPRKIKNQRLRRPKPNAASLAIDARTCLGGSNLIVSCPQDGDPHCTISIQPNVKDEILYVEYQREKNRN